MITRTAARKLGPLLAATGTYVLTIVAANYLTSRYGLVPVGWGLMVTAGTFAAGAALLVRDFLQRYARAAFGPRRGIVYVVAAIGVAGVVSWLLSTPALAVASTVAFVGAELVDLAVFTPTSDRVGFVPAVLASNIVSAPVDTVLFLAIAGFPITVAVVVGQLVAKLVYATAVPLILWVAATDVDAPTVA